MDLLLTPSNPSFPAQPVPFFPDKTPWSGTLFLTHNIHRNLQTFEQLDALSQDALHGFLQNWLFFGLLAEMFALNEYPEEGMHVLDPADAKREREMLYRECIVEKGIGGEKNQKVLTGRKALDSGQLMIERTRLAAAKVGSMQRRLEYLDLCLQLVARQFAMPEVVGKVDHHVRYSIAALGELFAMAISKAATTFKIPVQAKSSVQAWQSEYIAEGGELEKKLIMHGWCPSELEKIRSEIAGLNTLHYVSRLKKAGPRRDHTGCHKFRCLAFQIQLGQYRPAHAKPECVDCELEHVDIDGVLRILQQTDSYPVLAAESHSKTHAHWLEQKVQVEPFAEDLPYVAISHVWADGIGNPMANALPSCQIARLRRLVAELQDQLDPQWNTAGRPAYRVWVDTLCCPVELEGKKLSLERIADVYRNSTHTLVLDLTLTSLPSRDVDPAELLLRILSCSPWMRRLWTFQEGSLPKSLYFQFSDRAVSSQKLFEKLYVADTLDVRYKRLWWDSWSEISTFARFSSQKTRRDPYDNSRDILLKLQWALNSRSVSVPKDEPLCVATLLGLDLTRILSESDAQKRMAAVWEMVAKMLNGIPPRAIFFVDNPLAVQGFRWAPRSLLAADVERDQNDDTIDPYAEQKFLDSSLDLSHRSIRFGYDENTKLAQLVQSADVSKGLQGEYAGFRIKVQPYEGLLDAQGLTEDEKLHPWHGTLPFVIEDWIYLKDETTGDWYTISDYHLSRMIKKWTPGQVREWQLGVKSRLCDNTHTGRCAVIRNATRDASTGRVDEDKAIEAGLLVQIVERKGDKEEEEHLFVRRGLNVLIAKASPSNALVADTMSTLAAQLAGEEVTIEFLREPSSPSLKNKLKDRMRQLVSEALDMRPDFAAAALKTRHLGNLREDGWVLFAKIFSHRASIVRTPDDQVWLVD